MSLGRGLIYVHELLQDTGVVNAWYLSAIDFESGEPAWRKYLGSGKQWDYALLTVSIGPNGLLASGMLMGLAAVRDGSGSRTL